MTSDDQSRAPLLRVVGGGQPTDEELAALVSAVATLAAAGDRQKTPPSRWNDRQGQLRRPLHPGPGAWVAAARR